jgi:hypothetical protein
VHYNKTHSLGNVTSACSQLQGQSGLLVRGADDGRVEKKVTSWWFSGKGGSRTKLPLGETRSQKRNRPPLVHARMSFKGWGSVLGERGVGLLQDPETTASVSTDFACRSAMTQGNNRWRARCFCAAPARAGGLDRCDEAHPVRCDPTALDVGACEATGTEKHWRWHWRWHAWAWRWLIRNQLEGARAALVQRT